MPINIGLRAFQEAVRNIEEGGRQAVMPLEEAMQLQVGDERVLGGGAIHRFIDDDEFLRPPAPEPPPPPPEPIPLVRINPRQAFEDIIFNEEPKQKRKTGEELFRLILSGIREVYEVDAVIAGGAVRDLVVGDTEGSKDVDVFLPMKWEDFKKSAEELGWQVPPKIVKLRPYKTVVAQTSSARAAAVVQGRNVDLVFIEGGLTPESVDNFPVNAQKCVWNLQEGLVVSPAAKADIEGKKFTISPTIKDKEMIKTVRDKIADWLKRPCYKGWKVIEPDVKEWWQQQNDTHTVERGKKEKKQVWDDWADDQWAAAVIQPGDVFRIER